MSVWCAASLSNRTRAYGIVSLATMYSILAAFAAGLALRRMVCINFLLCALMRFVTNTYFFVCRKWSMEVPWVSIDE